MGSERQWLLLLISVVLTNLCASEFVPVYIWGPNSVGDPVPALQKTSESNFKDEIETKLKGTSRIVIFAEHSLSPEDFGQKDKSGNSAFPHLSKIRKTSKVAYLPSVQNPIKATRHVTEDVTEIPIQRLTEHFEIPDSKVLIIDLNDASENERRFDMLKRHDEVIMSVYENLLEKYGNVIAMYTGHHASWIASGHTLSRRTRAAEPAITSNQYMSNETVMFYTSGNAVATINGNVRSIPVTYSFQNESGTFVLIGTGTGTENAFSVNFTFTKVSNGYWYLQETSITLDSQPFKLSTNTTIYAPLGFSYACGNQTFKTTSFSVMFPSFQVEPVFKSTYLTKTTKFNDPYNCVGFTTIPIWSGLFVTFILLLIMTFGLTMMMDIKTMDRFDDAKGKTITINTSD
ncbi:hypothetical protein ABEB36_011371 [Hypothenemus hampei]|uniref:V-type proton ATPase subunit S1 n=1 Tax=Hypothenemus hampei TaxID=57062 RepID=A0ABD1EFI3_HYPHA